MAMMMLMYIMQVMTMASSAGLKARGQVSYYMGPNILNRALGHVKLQ